MRRAFFDEVRPATLRRPAGVEIRTFMIEHVSLRCSDSRASRRFYEQALTPLGYKLSKKYGDAFGFRQGGRHDFWVTKGKVGTPGHVAFTAADHKGVEEFHRRALKAGGKDNGAPGARAGYGYAAFVYDPDGHNIEAVCFDELEEGRKLEDITRRRIAQATAGSKHRVKRAAAKVARARRPKKAMARFGEGLKAIDAVARRST